MSIVAIVFIIAPFIFSFDGIDAYYYWINGIAILSVVSLHKSEVVVQSVEKTFANNIKKQ